VQSSALDNLDYRTIDVKSASTRFGLGLALGQFEERRHDTLYPQRPSPNEHRLCDSFGEPLSFANERRHRHADHSFELTATSCDQPAPQFLVGVLVKDRSIRRRARLTLDRVDDNGCQRQRSGIRHHETPSTSSCPAGSGEQILIEECRGMVARHSGGPQDAVLGVEFGRERPSSESAVHPVLGQPGGELPVAIKAETRKHVSDDVVDGPEPAEGTADLASHDVMAMVEFCGRCGDFDSRSVRTAAIISRSDA
jgi:hypothetical protein